MDILERYLQAVGQYLPAENKADTLAELRANLLGKMDEREEMLGRPLAAAEVSDVLKEHGRPELVALRYLPQRSLIGPTLFPFYVLTLKRTLPLVVLIYAIARGTLLVLRPAESDVAGAIAGFIVQLFPVLCTFLAVLTGVFAGIEYGMRRRGLANPWDKWDPAKLPKVASDQKKPGRAARVGDVIGQCVAIVYVLCVARFPSMILGPGAYSLGRLGVRTGPEWQNFYWWVVGVMFVQLGLQLLNLGREPRRGLQIAVKALGVVVLALVVAGRAYFVSSPGGMDVGRLNYGFNLGFRVILLLAVVDLGWLIWKVVRDARPGGGAGAAASHGTRFPVIERD